MGARLERRRRDRALHGAPSCSIVPPLALVADSVHSLPLYVFCHSSESISRPRVSASSLPLPHPFRRHLHHSLLKVVVKLSSASLADSGYCIGADLYVKSSPSSKPIHRSCFSLRRYSLLTDTKTFSSDECPTFISKCKGATLLTTYRILLQYFQRRHV